jgi:hypothetical protein
MKKFLTLFGFNHVDSMVVPKGNPIEEIVTDGEIAESKEELFVLSADEKLRNPYRNKKLHPILTWDDFSTQIYPGKVDHSIHFCIQVRDYRGRTIDGHYFYNVESGTILDAGIHELSVTFVPDNTFKYHNVSMTKDLEVLKKRPDVFWEPPIEKLCFLYRNPLPLELFDGVTMMPKQEGGEFVFTHQPGMILEIGQHKITVEYNPSAVNRKNYSRGYTSIMIEIAGAPVPLEWKYYNCDQPVSTFKGKRRKSDIGAIGKEIVYKDPLPDWIFTPKSLYEEATGTWIFDPKPGAILPAGWQDLRATLIPNDPTRFKISSVSQRVLIHKARTEISWETPSPIPEGELLDSYVLNAKNIDNLPGKFHYDPDFGVSLTQGVHTISVHFVPDDSNYEDCRLSVQLKILPKRQLRIMWLELEDIEYPTPLSRYQLNAMLTGAGSNSLGEFVYDPPLDTVLDAGTHELHVKFIPVKPSIAIAHASVTLKVLPTVARLVWNQPDAILEGEGLYNTTLNAYSTNVPKGEGTFIYDPPAGTVLRGGEHRLTCTCRPKNVNNFMENKISVKVLVRQRPRFMPRLTWPDPVPESPLVYGIPLGVMQLNAQCMNSIGNFAYEPPIDSVLPVGNHELLAVFHPFDSSKCIDDIKITSHVEIITRRPNFVWNPQLDLVFGKVLNVEDHCNATATFADGDINAVPGEFEYSPRIGTLLETGEYILTCRFSPTDTHNFQKIEESVKIFVHRAIPLIKWEAPSRPLLAPITWAHPAFPKPAHRGTTGDENMQIAGEWSYDFNKNEVWDSPGRYKLTVRYLPEDIINFLSGTAFIEIEVVDL